MNSEAISPIAAAIADPARAAMLVALAQHDRLAASQLAQAAGVSPSSASQHLARLMDAALITWQRAGRIRYYRLLRPDLTPRALEALSALGRTLSSSRHGDAEAGDEREREGVARTCYDHLGGRLGVALTEVLLRSRLISERRVRRRGIRGTPYGPTKKGVDFLRSFGIDPQAVRARPRSHAHSCLDRTEQRTHLAGALGAMLAKRMFELGWVRRRPGERAVDVTPAGRRGLRGSFGIQL